MKERKVLVACEFSGIVRRAFVDKGWYAMSCDLRPTILSCSHENAHREQHYRGPVEDILHQDWDLVLAFPPCTHLCVNGATQFAEKRKDGRQQQAIDFFMLFTELDCPWAIENPVGIMSTKYRKPDQIIQPWYFGHPESKTTCLWLHKLPKLVLTNVLKPVRFYCKECARVYTTKDTSTWCAHMWAGEGLPRWNNQTPTGQNKHGPSKDRANIRSITYPGIAAAMAKQWGE